MRHKTLFTKGQVHVNRGLFQVWANFETNSQLELSSAAIKAFVVGWLREYSRAPKPQDRVSQVTVNIYHFASSSSLVYLGVYRESRQHDGSTLRNNGDQTKRGVKINWTRIIVLTRLRHFAVRLLRFI